MSETGVSISGRLSWNDGTHR